MKNIHVPVTNRILDPAWAKAETERIFRPQLDVAADVCSWGSSLFQRIFETYEPKGVGDVVPLILFRQVLAMLDGTVVHLQNGAVYAAEPSLRSMLEASWSLEWLLEKGTDFDRRCYYVAFLRAQRTWMRMLIQGTPEYKAFHATGSVAASILRSSGAHVQKAKSGLREINRLLRRKSYRAVNSAFAQRLRSRKRRLPAGQDLLWYQVSSAESPRLMARALGREDEYFGLYRSFSDTSHGSKVRAHITLLDDGRVQVEPIRSPEKFLGVFSLAMTVAFHTYRVMVNTYRPGEMETFNRRYVERWRPAYMNVPEVQVVVEEP